MLYSQGFRLAEQLASKVVPLFQLCSEQLSSQTHYDFGLRALKSVLTSAGNLKRAQQVDETAEESVWQSLEHRTLIRSVCETVIPKLIAEDIPLLHGLVKDVFPGATFEPESMEDLRAVVKKLATDMRLVVGDEWLEKIMQLYQIQHIHHGVMLVGPSGSGKTTAWRVLLEAIGKLRGEHVQSYVIDPKVCFE